MLGAENTMMNSLYPAFRKLFVWQAAQTGGYPSRRRRGGGRLTTREGPHSL